METTGLSHSKIKDLASEGVIILAPYIRAQKPGNLCTLKSLMLVYMQEQNACPITHKTTISEVKMNETLDNLD